VTADRRSKCYFCRACHAPPTALQSFQIVQTSKYTDRLLELAKAHTGQLYGQCDAQSGRHLEGSTRPALGGSTLVVDVNEFQRPALVRKGRELHLATLYTWWNATRPSVLKRDVEAYSSRIRRFCAALKMRLPLIATWKRPRNCWNSRRAVCGRADYGPLRKKRKTAEISSAAFSLSCYDGRSL